MATHLTPQYERLARFISSAEGDRAYPNDIPWFEPESVRRNELSTRREFIRNGRPVFPRTADIEFLDKEKTIPEVEEAAWKWELREKARIEAAKAKSAMIKSVERLIRNLECKSANKRVPCSSITGKHEWSYTKQKDDKHKYWWSTIYATTKSKCKICHIRYKDTYLKIPVPPKSFIGKHEHQWDHLVYAPGEDVIAPDAKCTICHVKYKHP